MKWDKILKVIQIPKVNLDTKDMPPEYEDIEDETCRKKLIEMLHWGLRNYEKFNSGLNSKFLKIAYNGEDNKELTYGYITNLIMSLGEQNACLLLKVIESHPKGMVSMNRLEYENRTFTYYFALFEKLVETDATGFTNSTTFYIWDNAENKLILNISIDMVGLKFLYSNQMSKNELDNLHWQNADAEDNYQDFSNKLFQRNEGYDSQVPDDPDLYGFKKEDILKVIQIPKVNLDTEDKPPEYEKPDDKCTKEIIAFSDAMKKISYPFSDNINSNQGVSFGPDDETIWENVIHHEDVFDTDFGFNGNTFKQKMKYDLFIHNGRIKDGMFSSNLPEEVACRILELFDENIDKINFNIIEEVAGFKIEYYAAGGGRRPNSKELFYGERYDEDGNHNVVPEVFTTFINHSLNVFNPNGLEILEIETALTLKNVLTAMPPSTGSELQYNRDANELFMWFPNVIQSRIFHYVNIGKLYEYYQKGAYRF